ncbi:MAG: hypothetical protein IT435_03225 [Phycisphaerales bacterium]|nr:hypothetical protein [Phycisphaerales bacterium]
MQPNTSWIVNPDWTPNRLPGVVFMLFNGSYCSNINESNYRGLNEYWCDPIDDPNCALENGLTGVGVLSGHLNDAWAAGFRRFILYAPAGSIWGGRLTDGSDAGQEFLASSQWATMQEDKREELETLIGEWLGQHPDAWIEIYGSFPTMNNPTTRCLGPSQGYPDNYFPYDTVQATANCLSPAGSKIAGCPYAACEVHSPSPFSLTDVCTFDATIKPWQDLGIKRYWLDSAAQISPNNFFGDFIELAYCPLYRSGPGTPHFLGMESIPSVDLGGGPEGPGMIDMDRATQAPAIAFGNVLFDRDPTKTWDVSNVASSTELAVVLDPFRAYMETETVRGVLDWTQRGFVAYVVNPNNAESMKVMERVKRVYDFGIIQRGDFNGDGVVNSQDLTDFTAQYNCHNGLTSGCNYAHGDMDQDNDVDIRDHQKFTGYYFMAGSLDLGPCTDAEAMDALTRSEEPGCP